MFNRKALVAVAATALAASMSAAVSTTASASDILQEAPGNVTLDLKTVNGSGCPQGTAAVAMSPDNQAFTVTYSQYTAEIGKGIAGNAFRKNCQLVTQINQPQGFTYAVIKADYRGYANIAKGATGVQQANYYFQGESSTMKTFSTLKGEYDSDFTFTDEQDMASVVWAPCGKARLLNVNSSLRLNKGSSGSAYSLMSLDSTDVSSKTVFQLAWKKC